MRILNQLIIHCSDTPASMDIGADEIKRWHVEERGFNDIGYHYVIRRNGAIEGGRDISIVGAHAKGANEHSIGICLVGGKGGFNFTSAQFRSLDRLLIKLQIKYGQLEIIGHRDVSGTMKDCPCYDVKSWFSTEV